MPSSNRRDLFLQVSANIDNLRAGMKAGRSVLAEFGTAANDTAAEVQKAFANMGGGSIEQNARSIEAAYTRTFANIRANAARVMAAGNGPAAFQVLDAASADQAAAAAETQARGLRLVADAADRAAQATQGDATAAKVYATAAAAAAIGAEEQAVAMRAQATVLAGVRGQLEAAGLAEEELAGKHGRMGASGLIAEHVTRSLSDSIAAGQSPVRALSMEMGRITEAMTLFAATTGETEGLVGKFAGFMGGPWGLAISVGVAVLTPLIGKMIEAGTATKDAQKADEEYANYQSDLGNFIDQTNGKLRERLRLLADIAVQENRGKIDSSNSQVLDYRNQAFAAVRKAAGDGTPVYTAGGVTATNMDRGLDTAIKASGGSVVALRRNLNALVAGGRQDLKPLADQINDLAGKAAFARQKADDLSGSTSQLNDALHNTNVLTKESVERMVANATATTAVERAQAKIRDLQARGDDIKAMNYGPQQQAAYKQWEKDLIAATEAMKKLQAAKRDETGNRQVGRQIDLSQAEDIVRGIGGRITSAQRSTAEQGVLYSRYLAGTGSLAARPGTSEHERGQALDVAKAVGITLATLKNAFAAQGVHLTEALDEGNHYHVAWGPKGPSADAMARRQEAGVRRAANDDRSYQDAVRQAQDRYAQAMLGLSDTTDKRYEIEVGQLRSDLAQRNHDLQDQVTAGKMTQARATQLEITNAITEKLQEELANRRRISAGLSEQIAVARAASQAQAEEAQLRERIAPTRSGRYSAAQDQLSLQQARDRGDIEWALDPRNDKISQQDRGIALAQYQNLDERQSLQRQDLAQQYADPLQRYRMGLQQNVGDMNDALKGVASDGLKGIEDGLVGILSHTESVSQAFRQMASSIVADLARIVVEKLILKAIGGSFFSDGGKVDGFALGGVPGFAGGVLDGKISGPGTGTSDSIFAVAGRGSLIRVSNGEGIMTAKAVRKWWPTLDAMNKDHFQGFATGGLPEPRMPDISPVDARRLSAGRSGSGASITFDLRNAVVTEDLLREMNTISARHSMAAVIGGARQAAEDRHDDAYSAIPQ